MKKLFNLFATILAVSVLTIGFASCANDSSDSSSSSSSGSDSKQVDNYITFVVEGQTFTVHKVSTDKDIATGTYTGDPTKDGGITLTSDSKDYKCTITDGKFTLNIGNGDIEYIRDNEKTTSTKVVFNCYKNSSNGNSSSGSSSSTTNFLYEGTPKEQTIDASVAEKLKEYYKKDFSAYVGKIVKFENNKIFEFSDSTYKYSEKEKITCEGTTIYDDSKVIGKGTYKITGDFTSGNVSYTKTYGYIEETKTYGDYSTPSAGTVTIANGKFKYNEKEYTKQ